MTSLAFLLVLFAACVVSALAAAPKPNHIETRDVAKRDYAGCANQLYKDAWQSELRPKDVVAALCYHGAYTPYSKEPEGFVHERQHECSGEKVGNRPALFYNCFFLKQGNGVTLHEGRHRDDLAMWMNHKVCKWQDKGSDIWFLNCDIRPEDLAPTKRHYEECAQRAYRDAWKSKLRPKDVTAAVCFSGLALQTRTVTAVAEYDCYGRPYWCFFLTKGNGVEFYSSTDPENLAMWWNHKVCQWDKAKVILSC